MAVGFVALSWSLYGGYLTDDSYIHFVYARNFAEGAGLSFNPGEPSYGSTSPLWVSFLAAGTAAGWATPEFAQAASMFFSAACIFILAVTAFRVGTNRAAQLLPPLVLAADPWFQRWSVSGMEVGLAPLLVLLGFYGIVAEPRRSATTVGSGVFMGLALLARPEVALLIALTGLCLIVLRRAKELVQFGAGVAVPVGVWIVFAYLHFGTIIPNSFVVKTRQTPSALQSIADSVAILAASTLIPVVVVVLVLAMLLVFSKRRAGVEQGSLLLWLVPILWTAGAVAQYSYRGVNVASRYMCLYSPLLLLCAAWCLNQAPMLLQRFGVSRRVTGMAGWALVAAAVLQPAAVGVFTWRNVKTAETSYSQNHHAIAEWISRESEPMATVGTYDVGIIAYRSRRPIVDLAGLTDTLAVRNLRLSLPEKIKQGRPAFVVLQGKTEGEFIKRHPEFATHLEPVFHTEMFWGPGSQSKDIFTVYRGRW